jgi:hypothetical protein
MPKLCFQIPELRFQMPKLSFQMPKLYQLVFIVMQMLKLLARNMIFFIQEASFKSLRCGSYKKSF